MWQRSCLVNFWPSIRQRRNGPTATALFSSAGHGSMLLYSLLYLTGYADFPIETVKRFRQWLMPAGHPGFGHGRGLRPQPVLGQGWRLLWAWPWPSAIWPRALALIWLHHRTYVLASDGDLMEGVSHEAASLAGHLGLSRLIVLFDDNKDFD